MSPSSLPYEEPTPLNLLILTSFFLLLTSLSTLISTYLHCGLIIQIFTGVAYGAPGLSWLPLSTQHTITSLGYLGLILLVYEGGLSANLHSLKSNAFLSIAVALTGIALPIALSFVLVGITEVTSLQAFAAGAALCSTSLGTTFTVLQSSGLERTRLGVVLATAAMLDDVVGLVMVKVIGEIGEGEVEVGTVVRPVGVSVALLVLVLLGARMGLKPLLQRIGEGKILRIESRGGRIVRHGQFALAMHVLVLVGMVTGAGYAGTSNLFSAYLAGALISWCDEHLTPMGEELSHTEKIVSGTQGSLALQSNDKVRHVDDPNRGDSKAVDFKQDGRTQNHASRKSSSGGEFVSGKTTFERYFSIPLETVFKPFFFASIGFAIPITKMFSGGIVWRGIVYTVLMFIAKLATGLWLLRLAQPKAMRLISRGFQSIYNCLCSFKWFPLFCWKTNPKVARIAKQGEAGNTRSKGRAQESAAGETSTTSPPKQQSTITTIEKPLSLYPPSILGLAMVARGEIGYLIASLAESKGVFKRKGGTESTEEGSSEIYLIVIWAITLCTIIGPISVGILVRRVKNLQKKRETKAEARDPLGCWGVD